MSLEYFYDAVDKDAIITEEVSNHPELMDVMDSREDEEWETACPKITPRDI